MSKPLKAIAIVAGVVAISFAIPGVGTAITGALGLGAISVGTAATIAGVASAVAVTSAAGALALPGPPREQSP